MERKEMGIKLKLEKGLGTQLIIGLLLFTMIAFYVFGIPLLPEVVNSIVEVKADTQEPIELTANRTAHQKLYYLGQTSNGQAILKLVSDVNVVHYRDANGDWQDIDLDCEEVDTGEFNIQFTKLAYYGRVGENSKRRIYPDRNDLSYWIQFDKPYANMGTPIRNDRWFYWDFSDAALGLRFDPSAVKFGFRLKNSNAPKSITLPFSTQGITRIGKVLYHDGEVVGWLQPPTAVDAEGITRDVEVSWGQGEVTLTLDTSGLAYPIDIDPTIQVGASTDDGYEVESSGAIYLTSSLLIKSDASSANRRIGFARWASSINQSVDVQDCYISFYINPAYGDDINAKFYFEDTATPATGTTNNYDISSRDKTTNYVEWVEDDVASGGTGWYNTGNLSAVLEEVTDSTAITHIAMIAQPNTDATKLLYAWSYDDYSIYAAKITVVYVEGGAPPSVPTVTTVTATNIEATTATATGNITDTGGENCTMRGIWWDTDSGVPYANSENESGDYGVETFNINLTGLPEGTTIYYVAFAVNSEGTGNGIEETFLTKPAAPTNVAAGDGSSSDNVTVTWTKSSGATDYQVYRDGNALGWLGDVDTYTDTGADAPTITGGDTVASDGASTSNVSLSLSGTSANDGTSHTYKVRAKNGTGESSDSSTDTGYRGVGALSYQWQRSAADSDADYSNIDGATSSTYEDASAPTPTITGGTASASDNTTTDNVTLTIAGASANVGDGRYYKCVLNAAGASENTSSPNRGYVGVGSLTYQWSRSAADSDADYSTLDGATTASYGDTTAPSSSITSGNATATDGDSTAHISLAITGSSTSTGDGRYYYCTLNATGATENTTTHDRGYRAVGSLTYQWQRSAADSDADYSNIDGATSSTYNDTGAPAPTITPGTASAGDGASTENITLSITGESTTIGDGRYYKCVLNASGASENNTASDRGYRGVGAISYQWSRSAADSDADYSTLDGATADPYVDTTAPSPTITSGSTVASDGDSTANVSLSLSGTSANNGDGRYYYCTLSADGASNQDTTHDRGYMGVGSLSYQWQRSSADSDADYSNIDGAMASAYEDASAPSPTITGGTASASDNTSTDNVTLSITGESANLGDGRYYQCVLNADGATENISTANRGYRGVGALTYQWYRSSGDSDEDYSVIDGATSAPYDDTDAPAPTVTGGTASATDGDYTTYVILTTTGASANVGAGRYYYSALTATGATANSTTHDRGYRSVGSLGYQWWRSSGDSDADFILISGATSEPYNDTTAPAGVITPGTANATDGVSTSNVTLSISGESVADGAGRYFYCVVTADGAVPSNTTHDRGYRTVGAITYQWYRSAANSDENYSTISGATIDPYEDTASPAPTITVGTASASQGTYADKVALSMSGQSANNGETRYFYCAVSAEGATTQNTDHTTGYIGVGSLTYQWQRSASTSDADYSNIDGATTASYDDVDPSLTEIRWYRDVLDAIGASQQITAGVQGWVTGVAGNLPLPPSNFIVTRNALNSFLMEWSLGTYAGDTVIIAKDTGYPQSVSDGYVVYSGNATSSNVTGVELGMNTVYLSAFSSNGLGYSESATQTNIGGEVMIFVGIIGLAILMSWVASRSSYYILKFLSGFIWIGVGVYWNSEPIFDTSSSVHTIFYILFWGLGLAMAFMPLWYTRLVNGVERSGFNLRLPTFMGGVSEEEELAETERRGRTWGDRRNAYQDRLNNASRGRRR